MVWYGFKNATDIWQVVASSMQTKPPFEYLLITATLHIPNSTTGTDEETAPTIRDSIKEIGDDSP